MYKQKILEKFRSLDLGSALRYLDHAVNQFIFNDEVLKSMNFDHKKEGRMIIIYNIESIGCGNTQHRRLSIGIPSKPLNEWNEEQYQELNQDIEKLFSKKI